MRTWQSYDDVLSERIADMFASWEKQGGAEARFELCEHYVVDFHNMVQENVETGTARRVRKTCAWRAQQDAATAEVQRKLEEQEQKVRRLQVEMCNADNANRALEAKLASIATQLHTVRSNQGGEKLVLQTIGESPEKEASRKKRLRC
eukprot:6484349-Amphidinium_carterae.1